MSAKELRCPQGLRSLQTMFDHFANNGLIFLALCRPLLGHGLVNAQYAMRRLHELLLQLLLLPAIGAFNPQNTVVESPVISCNANAIKVSLLLDCAQMLALDFTKHN